MPASKSSVEKNFKKGVQIGLKHSRTRRKYHLLPNPTPWRKIRPRCSNCKNPTISMTIDLGPHVEDRVIEIARYCKYCEVIFPKYRKIVSTYMRGDDT